MKKLDGRFGKKWVETAMIDDDIADKSEASSSGDGT